MLGKLLKSVEQFIIKEKVKKEVFSLLESVYNHEARLLPKYGEQILKYGEYYILAKVSFINASGFEKSYLFEVKRGYDSCLESGYAYKLRVYSIESDEDIVYPYSLFTVDVDHKELIIEPKLDNVNNVVSEEEIFDIIKEIKKLVEVVKVEAEEDAKKQKALDECHKENMNNFYSRFK